MALRLIYESGANNETTDITEHLQLYTWESTELAEEGSVGTSEITLEDPDGTLDIVAWRRIWAYEDTATGSNSLIYYGWITDKRVERGPYKTGTSRVWRVSMVDQNAVLSFRVFRGSGASRPEETDVHRIEWMMDFVDSFGRAPIVEDEFVFGAGTKTMDAVDYKGQYTLDLINDCAQMTGKNFYVYTKDNGYPSAQPTRGLWYGSDLHTAYASPLRLSNDLADIDSVLTFAISEDTSLERRADRVYSGVYIQADNNIAVYEQRASTYNQFTQRDITVPAPNVKTVARATTRAQRNLDDLDSEEDRISTAVYLPAHKVNFIKAGMRVQFKALHLPDYGDGYTWLRVLSRTVTEVSEAEDTGTPHYYVSLVLSQGDPPQTITAPAQAGAGVLYTYIDNNVVDSGELEFYINGTTIGNIAGLGENNTTATPIPEGFLQSGDNVVAVKIRNGEGSEYWWGGNGTGFEMRLFNESLSTLYAYTSVASVKILPLSNEHGGTLNPEPSGWEQAGFDDSGWEAADDVTGSLNGLGNEIFPDPISPARTVAPLGAEQTGFVDPSYAYHLVWLVRVNFTI